MSEFEAVWQWLTRPDDDTRKGTLHLAKTDLDFETWKTTLDDSLYYVPRLETLFGDLEETDDPHSIISSQVVNEVNRILGIVYPIERDLWFLRQVREIFSYDFDFEKRIDKYLEQFSSEALKAGIVDPYVPVEKGSLDLTRGELKYERWEEAQANYYLPELDEMVLGVSFYKPPIDAILDWAEATIDDILAIDRLDLTNREKELLAKIKEHFCLGYEVDEQIEQVLNPSEEEARITIGFSQQEASEFSKFLNSALVERASEAKWNPAIAQRVSNDLNDSLHQEPTLDEEYGQDKADIFRAAYEAGLDSEVIFKLKNALYTHPELTVEERDEAANISAKLQKEMDEAGQTIIDKLLDIIEDDRVPMNYGFLFGGSVY